jgi:uncharacterized membrane protein
MGFTPFRGGGYFGMTNFEIILAIVNTPVLVGIFIWIIKVEVRLTKIETRCQVRKRLEICDSEGNNYAD